MSYTKTITQDYSENGWILREVWGSGTLEAYYVAPGNDFDIEVFAGWEADDAANILDYDTFEVSVNNGSYSSGVYEGAPTMGDIRECCREAGLTEGQIATIPEFPETFHKIQMKWNQLMELDVDVKAIKALYPDIYSKVSRLYISIDEIPQNIPNVDLDNKISDWISTNTSHMDSDEATFQKLLQYPGIKDIDAMRDYYFKQCKLGEEGDNMYLTNTITLGLGYDKDPRRFYSESLKANEESDEFTWEDYRNGTMGDFMRHLSRAFDEADLDNLERLADAFPWVYKVYTKHKGDVLAKYGNRFNIVYVKDLKEGHTYYLYDTMFYGPANDYFDTDPEYIEQHKEQVKAFKEKYIDSNNDIVIPAGTKVYVTDTGHGAIYLEIEGLEFACIFDDDFKFKEAI